MNKKYIWLIEIIIWLLILSSCLFFFVYKTAIKDNAGNTYYIFFDDVDGIVKGSAVRLMGINIGYVRDVKIFDNKVFVSFLVTKENVEIPRSATATIEFYGLGGSVSLELNPSNISLDSESKEEIIPSESYRVQDFWDGQKLVANVMIDIYGGIGRTIASSGLLNNKEYLKQSSLLKNYSNLTQNINTSQNVIIYKMTENVQPYIIKKQMEELNQNQETVQEEENNMNTEVQENE